MTVAADRPARSRAEFHLLTVKDVDPLTDDSAAITFHVPDDLAADFAFQAGQSLTVTSIFLPLICGGELLIYSQEEHGPALPRIMRDNRITLVKLTPSHLKMVRESGSWPSGFAAGTPRTFSLMPS